ncbi:DUF3899 domain-containing protein [Virgibacillus sp. DJP39]|uniref:DUF3899 domain-containing protein n=1 Tax=Virgibacillus sp. DJP39 TaxID=3409790 RepID=UPI003BB66442
MELKKNKWIFFLVNLFVSVLIFIFSESHDLKHFINSIFYVTLAYFILMLFLFIIKGRFFDGISWSFRKFRSVMSKERDYLTEIGDVTMPSDRISIPFYRFIAFQTAALLLSLVLLLIVYYI